MRGLPWIICFSLMCIINTSHALDDATLERIRPEGRVSIAGDKPAAKPVQVSQAKPEAVSGDQAKKTYDKYCALCHNAGVAGAPKLSDVAAWKVRLTQKGAKKLLHNAIKGINAMPAKGTCMECSDDMIKDAIVYMLPDTLKKTFTKGL